MGCSGASKRSTLNAEHRTPNTECGMRNAQPSGDRSRCRLTQKGRRFHQNLRPPIGRCEIPEGLVDYKAVNSLHAGIAGEVNVETGAGLDPGAHRFALVVKHTPGFVENISPWTVLVD